MQRQMDVVFTTLTLFFGEEIRDRQIAFAGVVVEPENPRIFAQFRKFPADRGEGRAGRNADQYAFFPRRAASHILGIVGSDLNHPVEQ